MAHFYDFLPAGTGAGKVVLGLGLIWFLVVAIGTFISPRTFGVQDGPTSTVPNDDIDKDVAASGNDSEQSEAPKASDKDEQEGDKKTTEETGDSAKDGSSTGSKPRRRSTRNKDKKSDQDGDKSEQEEGKDEGDD